MGKTLRAALTGVVAAGGVALAGTGNAAAVEPRPVPAVCLVPNGVWPGHSALIGDRQNGKTICVVLGGRLLVSLSAPAGAGMQWQRIVTSPAGILTPAPLPVTLSQGVTAADFLARRPGVVTLSSDRRACPPAGAGAVSCDALVSWRATVVVRGPLRVVPQPEKGASPPVAQPN